ncbi:MAG TPA: alpha/beta fold hydrolase [Candidatus Paceibacterota bacterium]|nr:alpha/beta fold hydrolase [Candidatus Paceibacterota bacterium]
MALSTVVDFKTPKGFNLTGLWYGPRNARTVLVFIHGLGASAFGRVEREIAPLIVDRNTAVFVFNNRGHDTVSNLYKDDRLSKKGYKRIDAGTAHERFTDCADDIQGAIRFVRRSGGKQIYLGGHSTGCQKSVYWAYKHKGRGVKGLILLAPMSDWAGEVHIQGAKKVAVVAKTARAMVATGKGHTLLPKALWHETLDAQRFLSLYTPDSVEEIFSYAQQKKVPYTLRAVQLPQLVLLAEQDEYADRYAVDIAAWFATHINTRSRVCILASAKHSFRGAEEKVARQMRRFMKES